MPMLFYLINCPLPKDTWRYSDYCNVKKNKKKENQQIIWEAEAIKFVLQKMTFTSIIKVVADEFSVDQLIELTVAALHVHPQLRLQLWVAQKQANN